MLYKLLLSSKHTIMSSFYEDASLVMIPSGYKTSKVYSAKPTDGAGDLVFTRTADTATRVGPDGLIEKVRTNVLTYSNDTSNPAWSRVGATPTSGQSGYDGSSDAWLFSASGAGAHYALQSETDTGILTFSIYAKQGTSKGIRIAINGGGDHWANFNLDLGTQIGTAASVLDTEIVSVGSGWYRISVTANKTTSGGWVVVYILDNSFATSFTAAGETIFIQDAQLEAGDIATDYIATTTAAVSVGPVANVPRLDYLGSSCPRLLLEPQRSSLVTFSEQPNNAIWTKRNTTISANSATSPDGYTNADKIQEDTTNDRHDIYQDFNVTSGTAYTISAFVKAAERTFCFLTFGSSNVSPDNAFFNLSTGAVVSSPAAVTSTITSYGNGWYRITSTATAVASGLAYVVNGPTLNASGISYQGVSGSGILVYGYGAEAGAYATSYVPTLGAAVTRGADAASKTGISSLIGQTEGTLFLDFEYNQPSPDANGRLLQVYGTNDTTDSILPLILGDGAGVNRFQLTTFSASLSSIPIPGSASTVVPFGRQKFAIAYNAGAYTVYRNGSLFASGSGLAPVSLTAMDLGHSSSFARSLANPINQALVFNTRLSNSSLAELTA